jgi:hypothetical protein
MHYLQVSRFVFSHNKHLLKHYFVTTKFWSEKTNVRALSIGWSASGGGIRARLLPCAHPVCGYYVCCVCVCVCVCFVLVWCVECVCTHPLSLTHTTQYSSVYVHTLSLTHKTHTQYSSGRFDHAEHEDTSSDALSRHLARTCVTNSSYCLSGGPSIFQVSAHVCVCLCVCVHV